MYEVRDLFSSVKAFALSCPFLEEYNVEFKDVLTEELSGNYFLSAYLSYVGSINVGLFQEISGGSSVSREEVFEIKLTQNSLIQPNDTKLFGFIDNFQQWVDFANASGLTEEIFEDEDLKVWADSHVERSKLNEEYCYFIKLHVSCKRNYL